MTFVSLKPDKLRFYLDGESGLVNILYELLFSRLNRILVRDLTPGSQAAPGHSAGFCAAGRRLRTQRGHGAVSFSSFAGHRLLMEYFAFPEKFFFVDLCGLEAVAEAGFKDAIEVIFLLSEIEAQRPPAALELELSKKTFRLGCAPIVNLFSQTAEPIQLNQRRVRVPDRSRRAPSLRGRGLLGRRSRGINSANQKITDLRAVLLFAPLRGREDRTCFWLARAGLRAAPTTTARTSLFRWSICR